MEIYNDYLKTIKTALKTGRKDQEKSFSHFDGIIGSIEKAIDIDEFLLESKSTKLLR